MRTGGRAAGAAGTVLVLALAARVVPAAGQASGARTLAAMVRRDSVAELQWSRIAHTAPDTGFVYSLPPAAWRCAVDCDQTSMPVSLHSALDRKDPSALYWLSTELRDPDWLGQGHLADTTTEYYLRGTRVSSDQQQKLQHKLIKQGYAPMAEMVEWKGDGENAMTFDVRASRAGWPPAMYELARFYERLHDSPDDYEHPDRVRKALPPALDPAHPGSVWLRRAMAAGYEPAYLTMALWLWGGEDGFPHRDRTSADSVAGDLISRSRFPLLAYRVAAAIDSGTASGRFRFTDENGHSYTDGLLPARIYQALVKRGFVPAARRMVQYCQNDWELWGDCSDDEWRWQRPLALAGDTAAMLWLGRARDTGVGAPRDSTAALAWYVKAANSGVGLAWAPIAIHLERGAGVAMDSLHAVAFYARGVKAGDPLAMERLGQRVLTGRKGVGKDTLAAIALFAGALGPYLDRAGPDNPVALTIGVWGHGGLPEAARGAPGLTDSTSAVGCYTCRNMEEFDRLFATALYHVAAFVWHGWKQGTFTDTASVPWVARMLARSKGHPVVGRGSPAALYTLVARTTDVRAGRAILSRRRREAADRARAARKSAFEAAAEQQASQNTQDADQRADAAAEARYAAEQRRREARKAAYWQGVFQSLQNLRWSTPSDEDDSNLSCSETWTTTLHYAGTASQQGQSVQVQNTAPVVCGGS